jgi:hypothetical protein
MLIKTTVSYGCTFNELYPVVLCLFVGATFEATFIDKDLLYLVHEYSEIGCGMSIWWSTNWAKLDDDDKGDETAAGTWQYNDVSDAYTPKTSITNNSLLNMPFILM